MDESTVKNLREFYTPDMLDDWATYDPSGVEAYHKAVNSKIASAVVFGLDGIPLKAITQERYIMDGSFDAEAFSSGRYILAIGPAAEPGRTYSSLPSPSAGSTIHRCV